MTKDGKLKCVKYGNSCRLFRNAKKRSNCEDDLGLEKCFLKAVKHRADKATNRREFDTFYRSFDGFAKTQADKKKPLNKSKSSSMYVPVKTVHPTMVQLVVAKSNIPAAGNGLFAVTDIPSNCWLTSYHGLRQDRDNYPPDQRHMICVEHICIKGNSLPQSDKGGGQFINHHDSKQKQNVKGYAIIALKPADIRPRAPAGGNQKDFWDTYRRDTEYSQYFDCILLKSIKPIKAGEELYLDYGKGKDIAMGHVLRTDRTTTIDLRQTQPGDSYHNHYKKIDAEKA